MGQVKERGGVGEERKETLADKPRPSPPPPRSFIFKLSLHFSRGRNWKSRSSSYLGLGYKDSDIEVDVSTEGLDNLPFINRGDIDLFTEIILVLWSALQLLEQTPPIN